MKTNSFRVLRTLAVAATLLVGNTSLLRATTYTWTGAGFFGNVDYLWSNPFNWSGNVAPTGGEANVVIVFPNSAVPKVTTNDIAGLAVSAIQFQGPNYVVHGKPSNNTLAMYGTGLGGFSISATADNCQIASTCPLVLSNAGSITVSGANDLTIAARLSGNGGFTKFGPGTLRFVAISPNTFAGDVNINDGTLDVSNSVIFPSPGPAIALPTRLIIGGTNESLSPVVRLLNDDQIADAVPVTVNRNGKLWLNTHDDAIGSLTVAGGLVNTGLGNGTSSPGLLTLNGNVTNLTASGPSTISGRLSLGLVSRTFDVASTSELDIDATISGSVGFNAGLTKAGGGLLMLYGATNTYPGSTVINDGAIRVTGPTRLLGNTSGATVVNPNGQLILDYYDAGVEPLTINGGNISAVFAIGTNTWDGNVTLNGNCPVNVQRIGTNAPSRLTFSGVISGSGGIEKRGRGWMTLTGPQPNTFTGALIAGEGFTIFMKTSSVAAVSSSLIIGRTNQPAIQDSVTIENAEQIPTTVPIRVLESGYIFCGVQETVGDVEMVGGQLLAWDGTISFAGSITNRAASTNATMLTFTGSFFLTPGPHVIHCDSGSGLTFFDPLDGLGGVTKTGPGVLKFTDANTYGGATLIQGGFLVCEDKGRLGSSVAGTEIDGGVLQLNHVSMTNETLTLHGDSGIYSLYIRDACAWQSTVTLLGDATLQFENANGLTNTFTINGQVNGAGGLRVDGDGELILTGSTDNTFAGPLWVRSSEARLKKSSGATAVSSSLIVGADDWPGFSQVTLGAANQIGNTAPVELHNNAFIALGSFNETIGELLFYGGVFSDFTGLLTLNGNVSVFGAAHPEIRGPVSLGGATRNVSTVPGSSIKFGGAIQDGGGAAGITKTGTGSMTLASANSYAGPTTVAEGYLMLVAGATPGSPAGPTILSNYATLSLSGVAVFNETLIAASNSSPQVSIGGTNEWHGPIQVGSFLSLDSSVNGVLSRLLVDGTISGAGSVSIGNGALVTFAGSTPNTFSGFTHVNYGTLRLNKAGVAAITGDLFVGTTNVAESANVWTDAPNQFAITGLNSITINRSGALFAGDFNQRVPELTLNAGFVSTGTGRISFEGDIKVAKQVNEYSTMAGHFALGSALSTTNTRTFNVLQNATLDVNGDVSGGPSTGNFHKIGPGRVTFSESNSFQGTCWVEEGRLWVSDAAAFGSIASFTVVGTNGSVVLNDIGASNAVKKLFLFEGDSSTLFPLVSIGTNIVDASISLLASITVSSGSGSLLVLRGAISGNGDLTKDGLGVLRLAGTAPNTFTGTFVAEEGVLELAKTNALAVPGELTLGNDFWNYPAVLRSLQPNQVRDDASVTINEGATWEMNGFNETIGGLSGSGDVSPVNATLTISNTVNCVFGGVINTPGSVTKSGAGTVILNGNNTYTGTTTVNGGTLLVNGQQSQSAVSLLNGGQIGGFGRVGNISALNGHVSPGASPGKLSSGNLSFFSPSSLLKIEIGGTNAGVSYDQVDVTGTVLLMGGTLAPEMKFAGAVSNQYIIVKNDGADAVSGTFAGVPEGSFITNNGAVFAITYHGGDGNDIALIQKTVETGAQIGSAQPLTGGAMQLSATGLPNTTYTVQATPHLNAPIPWATIGTAPSDANGFMQFIDGDARQFPMRFYRFVNP